ncbi:MAG: PIG-L family deacetylase [Clostridia bacterium]|nr:PIG-L family deacetylase [Clostridia bacterium]
MSGREKKIGMGVIRWGIPVLAVWICLSFRFSRFMFQAIAALLCFAVPCALFCTRRRLIRSRAAAVTVFLLLLIPYALYACVVHGVHTAGYREHGMDRNMYKGQKILVMVPHQDDEINLCGGLYEVFGDASDVYILFSTNGDWAVKAEERLREAVNAAAAMGVDRDHLIFLGYGDGCVNEDGIHMYNLPEDEPFVSNAGYSQTYGAYGFEPYRVSPYTRNHMKNDIRDLLLDLRPDVVFCLDYDSHHDHRALSLLFEEAMGEILAGEENTYVPTVFKGFAYSTAYWGADDFYADNIISTVPWSRHYPYPGSTFTDARGETVVYMGENNIYLWKDRIRFPVAECSLSRTLRASSLYKAMHAHASQEFLYQAFDSLPWIINGDKVFWIRHTAGMLYGADVSVSSGDGSMLNDFKLTDSQNIYDKERLPFDNLWAPEAADPEKTAAFAFGRETAVDSICLYDHPTLTDNITRVRLLFSDGSEIECGPLAVNGSGTWVRFAEKRITGFTVQILDAEGERPGLCEVEAYRAYDPAEAVPEMFKLQDRNGDFVYDYWLTDAEEVFTVYDSRAAFRGDHPKSYTLKALSGKADIRQDGADTFAVSCAVGQSAELALYAEGTAEPVDLVTVRHPRGIERAWVHLLIEAEKNFDLYSPAEQLAYFQQIIGDYWSKLPFARK